MILTTLTLVLAMQFVPDCSSASPGSRCSANDCVDSGPSSGCILSGPSCETCYFAGIGNEKSKGQVVIIVSNPGHYSRFGLRRADLVWKINGSGLNSGDDFSTIDKLLKPGTTVRLEVLRRSRRRGFKVVVIYLKYYS